MASLHNKIQTFQLGLPKSDIFLDLDLKPEKLNSSSNASFQKVITLERPTPKLLLPIEPERCNLIAKTQDSFIHLKTKVVQIHTDFYSFLQTRIFPKFTRVQYWTEIFLCNCLALLLLPIVLSWVLLLLLVRRGVTLYLKFKYGDTYILMNGADAAWGLTKYAHDNCFTSLYTIQGDCSISKIRDRIKTSLIDHTRNSARHEGCIVRDEDGKCGESDNLDDTNSNNRVPEFDYVYLKMRSKIVQKCGFYCWEKCPEFDISKHVIFLEDAQQFAELDQDGLLHAMKSFLDSPLPPDLPQWVIYVIPRFRPKFCKNPKNPDGGSNYYSMIWRINHSIMDGVSAIHAMQNCIADAPVKMSIDATISNPDLVLSFAQKFCLYLHILTFGSRTLIKSLRGGHEPNCFQGPELTGPKNTAWSKPICFQSLKQIKNVMGSSITAVLLSSFGGALRKLAIKKNLPIPARIRGSATSAVLPYPDFGPQNRFTLASYPLDLEEDCPIQRLKVTGGSVNEFGGYAETVKNYNMIRFIGLHPVVGIEKMWDGLHATFLLSNVPGPAERYSLFHGDSLVDLIAWNTIKGKTGIGLCLLSYAGKTSAALICDGAVLPNPADATTLIHDFESEILDLAKVCGIAEEFVFTE